MALAIFKAEKLSFPFRPIQENCAATSSVMQYDKILFVAQ